MDPYRHVGDLDYFEETTEVYLCLDCGGLVVEQTKPMHEDFHKKLNDLMDRLSNHRHSQALIR